MKKIFVKLLAVLLVAVLALPLLASCGEQGEVGPAGEAGKNGAAGKSAYELAVEQGFTGTLEEWVASLAGKNGAVGASGIAGKDGEDGEDGKDARIGFFAGNEAELLAAMTIDNAYIVLIADITSDKTFAVPANTDVVLNLNGKTITSSVNPYTIAVGNEEEKNAKLTLIGNGTVTNTSDTSTTINNYGTLIIGEPGVEAAPTITMGAKTNDRHSAVKCNELCTLTIYNGIFEGQDRSIQTWGNTIILGGTFKKSVEAWEWIDGNTKYDSYMTILGGTFEGPIETGVDPVGSEAEATVQIAGGTFVNDPTAYLVTGYTAQEVTGGYTVVKADA